MLKIILASKSKVRKEILNKNNIKCLVEPANVDEHSIKDSLIKKGASPEIISKNLAELKAMAEKEGIEWNESDFKKSEAVITARIRALIARNIFDSDAFYYVISDINEALQDALEILDSGNYDKQLAANKP